MKKLKAFVHGIKRLWSLPGQVDQNMNYLGKNFERLSLDFGKITYEIGQLTEKQQRLDRFVGAVEASGIRRQWEGRIDVDFEKFLRCLDTKSQANLLVVLNEMVSPNRRIEAGQKKFSKKTEEVA